MAHASRRTTLPENPDDHQAYRDETAIGFMHALDVLGLDRGEAMQAHSFRKFNTPVSCFLGWQDQPSMTAVLRAQYGRTASHLYEAVRWVFFVQQVSAFITYLQAVAKPPKSTIGQHLAEAGAACKTASDRIRATREALADNEKLSASMSELGRHLLASGRDPDAFEAVFQKATHATMILFPAFVRRSADADRARELAHELDACTPGRAGWSNYEDTCLRVLRFLFMPPFRRVFAQRRSQDGVVRRDAIIPNTSSQPFWSMVRLRFECKNVVVEFKNLQAGATSGSVTQMRIYLDKPTIGKFGLLLTRKPPSAALLRSRRAAYSEGNGKLILILDDKLVKTALVARAYLGTANYLLEQLVAEFDVSY
jgi:hypothetical protein